MQSIVTLSVLGLAAATLATNKLPSGRIVGGYEVQPEFRYPWVVSLQTEGSHSCGGTLYDAKTVISAAHCIFGELSDWIASIHRHDLNKEIEEENGRNYNVIDRIAHPQYDLNGDNGYDVAIWKLDSRGSKRTGVVLDSGRIVSREGTLLTVIGWGTISSEGEDSSVLLEVKVPIYKNSKCLKAYGALDIQSQFCAGYPEGGKDSCQGDSGGPIFVQSGKSVTLVGIVSWGEGCAAEGLPGVYTRVSEVADFIEENSG